MPTLIHRRVEAARRGENPYVVARVSSGWVVMGDVQVVAGYCLLLPDPVVTDLNALAEPARSAFLRDMVRVGDVLLELTDAVRVNYGILGNLEPALHAHVFPRYADEPDEHRTKPVWMYDWKTARAFDGDTDRDFVTRLAAALERRQ